MRVDDDIEECENRATEYMLMKQTSQLASSTLKLINNLPKIIDNSNFGNIISPEKKESIRNTLTEIVEEQDNNFKKSNFTKHSK